MKEIALSEVKDDLSKYLRLAEKEKIVITRHGKPAGVLIGFESEDEWFDYRLEHDPRFLQRVEKARHSLRAGRGVRFEENSKFDEFTAIREAVGRTKLLSSIFDEAWLEEVWPKIKDSPLPGMQAATPSFHSLPHPLLDAARFEAVIQLFDDRLNAFKALRFKKNVVRTKIELLRKRRSEEDFLNHFFEINVLGDLALKGVLCDIEENTTKADGVINLAGRKIFIEATNTIQEVIPRFTEKTRVMAVDTDCQFEQVNRKLRKKVAEGRQLALAPGSPTVLFLARTYYGADRRLAEIEVNECFRSNEFAALSGVVLADSWKFQNTSWHPSGTSATPLTKDEKRRLWAWYAKRNGKERD